MKNKGEWTLIGPGNIGGELIRQLGQEEVAQRVGLNRMPRFIIRSSGIMEPDSQSHSGFKSLEDIDDLPEVTFVALPSTDDGMVAYSYISSVLARNKIVITAEKGALANYFETLKSESDSFRMLGKNATVGGGTRLISIAQEYCRDVDNVNQIHLSLNGTLSAILSSIAPLEGTGMSLGQAVHQAVKLDYAEPGSDTPFNVIRAEAEGDIPKKTAIFFNSLGFSEDFINWQKLNFVLSDEQISQVVEEARVRRFIVSIYPQKYVNRNISCPETDIIGGFNIDHDGWRIVGGFRHIERNPLFSDIGRITGPGNGMVIGLGPDETDGVYSVIGPGAGIRPTANTMIDDYLVKSAPLN